LQLCENILKLVFRVGVWNVGAGANFTRNYTESYTNLVESLHNKTLIITTIMTEPYTMLKENSEVLTGNDRYKQISRSLK
jgi:ionotropic glutamate receptor